MWVSHWCIWFIPVGNVAWRMQKVLYYHRQGVMAGGPAQGLPLGGLIRAPAHHKRKVASIPIRSGNRVPIRVCMTLVRR